jgi:hypothetical protein
VRNGEEQRLPHANSGEADVAKTTQNRPALKGGSYMRSPAVSKHLKDKWGIDRAPTTLDTLRCRSGGPRFFKAGASVLYLEDDVDDWARELLGEPVSSTLELREPDPRQLTREPIRAP